MAQAEFREVLSVDSQKLLDVVIQYERYPEFVEGCRSVLKKIFPKIEDRA